jgi:UDP-N-acetylmuramoyl-tripeptide--D-alanyl-D-alanine ligase
VKLFFIKILKKTLRGLAKATLSRYKPKIVGVTGNVGKTSTKIAIEAVLSQKFRVRSSAKNFNNELGLPLSILGNWKKTGNWFFWLKVVIYGFFRIIFKNPSYPEILVLEYGVDKPGDMKYLLNIARPQIGVVTAIGEIPVHVEFFTGKDQLAREKAILINQLPATGFVSLNADDITVYEMKDQTRAQIITFGFSEEADIKITSFETLFSKNLIGVTFKLGYGGSFIPVRIENVFGISQAYAAASAASIGLIFGVNLVNISEALSTYSSPSGRMKIIPGIKESYIVDDTYNAAPLAAENALKTLNELKAKRKIAVLGDMLEIGKYTIEAHTKIGKIAAKTVDILITVGIRGKLIADSARKAGMQKNKIYHFNKIQEAGLFLQDEIKKDDVVLVKASQAARFEKIVKEIMNNPDEAKKILVRQNKEWLEKKGSYE